MSDKRWYSVRVISGKEKNIEDNILRAADEAGIGNLIDEIFMPYEKIVKISLVYGEPVDSSDSVNAKITKTKSVIFA